MAARDLLVRVLGDTRDVENAFARSSRAATQFGASVDTTGKKADTAAKNIRGFAAGAAAGFGGAIVFNEVSQQLRAAIDVASNLQEQLSKTRVVFGRSADEIVAWSSTTAESIGVARDEALAAASTFGSMFDQAGQSAADVAGLSQAVVQLAADLASFNNTSIDDALVALRSGLSGEIEPLRRFQVFLTEATVAAEAMAESGKNSAKELTQGEKIMARWNLILRQTGKQQGDFARTSDGLANQQRILSAQVRDLQANVGELLLPVITDLATNLNTATGAALDLADALRGLGNVKVPVIDIPINFTFPGTDSQVGDVVKKGLGFATTAQFLGPVAAIGVQIAKQFEDQPVPDTKRAAEAFDAKFDTFLESLQSDLNTSNTRANAKLKAFGEKGFKPLETNELGESLQRQFDATVDSLELRVDQAKLSGNTTAALAALSQIEKTVRARIKVHGRTTELLRELFQVDRERASILEGIKQEQAAARQARVDEVLANLGLAVDRAQLTRNLGDDLKALTALAAGLRAQIARGGDVLGYQQQLLSVTGEIANVRDQIQDQAAEALQARQFRAIGLSATGGDIIPGVDNLQKQLQQLTARLGPNLTSKMRGQLAGVAKVLKGQFGAVTEESREAIRDLFSTIRDTFDKESKKEIAPRRVQISDKILRALGFDQDAEVAAFRATSNLTRGAQAFPTGVRPVAGVTATTTAGVTISGPITVVADDPDAFLRELQKKAGRTTATARGRFPGKSLGLG